MLEDPTLPSKVAALCDGLDAQSRATVARILSRIRTLYEQKQKTYTLLSQEEITELERIRTQFYPNVFQIAPDLYCYDGYLLSTRFFEISVLWHRHNLNAFSPRTLEAIKHKNIIDGGVRDGPFWVLAGALMPSVLIEIGYVSHQSEGKLLTTKDYQKLLATGIADGIEDYLDKN